MTIAVIVLKIIMLICNFILWLFGLALLYPIYAFFFPDRKWQKWKTLDEYWKEYPHCKTSDGTKCFKCGSRNVRQYGYDSPQDHRRIHKCNQSNIQLYRT